MEHTRSDVYQVFELFWILFCASVMSAPGEGLESVSRHSIDAVLEYLTARHDDNFLIFNLCSLQYNKERFLNKVGSFFLSLF